MKHIVEEEAAGNLVDEARWTLHIRQEWWACGRANEGHDEKATRAGRVPTHRTVMVTNEEKTYTRRGLKGKVRLGKGRGRNLLGLG